MESSKQELTYGEFIKELRIKNKLSQKDLASLLSLSFQTISKYETNKLNIDISLVSKLCRIFKIDVTSFFNKEGKEENDYALNHDFNYSTFLLTLSFYKEKSMISWKDLAIKVNIPSSRLSKIENNETLIRIDEFIKLANYFNVDYGSFYFGLDLKEYSKKLKEVLKNNSSNTNVNNLNNNTNIFIKTKDSIKRHPIFTSIISFLTLIIITISIVLPIEINKPIVNFNYFINDEDKLVLSSIDYSSSRNLSNLKELTIPSKIGDKDVYMISSYAISSLPNLKKINISEGTELISSNAFNDLSSLEEINLPSSLSSYYSFAFEGVPNLKTINLDEDNKYFKVINNDLYSYDETILYKVSSHEEVTTYEIKEGVKEIYSGAFSYLQSLKEVIFPSSIEIVDSNAFTNLSALEKVSFNEGLKSLSFASFLDCNNPNFNSIILPSSLSLLDGNPFLHMPNLTNISISKNNTSFKIKDNKYLTNYDEKILYSLFDESSSSKRLTLPSYINKLTKGSINSLDKTIKELVIPSSVSYCESFSIQNSISLDYIYIEEGCSNFEQESITNMDNDMIVGLEEKSLPSTFDKDFYEGNVIFGITIPK